MNTSSNIFKNYVICSHVDKTLTEEEPYSKYNCKIQAGAACTDKRICEINDFDNFSESISDRNPRYSELSAIFWISKHIDSEYTGISHYRRRFQISDKELEQLFSEGIDIITTLPASVNSAFSVAENYRRILYKTDLDALLTIFNKFHPEDYDLLSSLISEHYFHICNMNIYKSEIFADYAEWLFPVLDSFYHLIPEKTDSYSKRDVGFIAEILTSVYVDKNIKNGKKIVQLPIIQFHSKKADNFADCNPNSPESIFNACNLLFSENHIRRSAALFEDGLKSGVIDLNDPKYKNLYEIFVLQTEERLNISMTMCDYLPYDSRKDLDSIINIYGTLKTFIIAYFSTPSPELLGKFQRFLELTNFSSIVVKNLVDLIDIEDTAKEGLLNSLHFKY